MVRTLGRATPSRRCWRCILRRHSSADRGSTQLGVATWNIYAIVSTIELARTEPRNPELPPWLADEYFLSIRDLSKIGIGQLENANDPDTVRAILSVIALAKGMRLQAKFLLEYTEDELREMDFKL